VPVFSLEIGYVREGDHLYCFGPGVVVISHKTALIAYLS